MATCKQCGIEYSIWSAALGTGLCNSCHNAQRREQAMAQRKAEQQAEALRNAEQVKRQTTTSPLVTAFRILGVLELVGGLIICSSLWPREPHEGYEWRVIAYMPALTWLFAGVIFGCLFFAVAEGLTYLCEIRDAVTRRPFTHDR